MTAARHPRRSFRVSSLRRHKGANVTKEFSHQLISAKVASTKTRAEVRGTGKKPFRQKGGTARQGTRRGPQHYKGGAAFGPKPRDYFQKVNKKMKTLFLVKALHDRAVSGEVSLIEKGSV